MTATVEEEEEEEEENMEERGGGNEKITRTRVRAVSLLGSIAAIESFCDCVVPWLYGFGLWNWVVEMNRASLIFVLGAVFYFLASVVLFWKMSRRNTKT